MNRFFKSFLLLILAATSSFCWSTPNCEAQLRRSEQSSEAKFQLYVQRVINRYDENEDGKLEADEIAKMRRKPEGADSNNDGTLTSKELVEFYKERIRRSGGVSAEVHEDSNQSASESNESLTVDVFMLRATRDDSPLDKLATKLKGESRKAVDEMLRAVRRDKDLGCDIDTMQFTVTWNQKFRLTVASEVPVVTGISSLRGGGTSSNIENYSIGTTLSFLASNETDQKMMYIDLNKSSVFESDTLLYKTAAGDETYARSTATVELNSEFAFEKNEANVITMSDSGSTWLLIFVAQ